MTVQSTTKNALTAAEVVELKGQSWCLMDDPLEWGLGDYCIVKTESGQRLIMCNIELVRSPGSVELRERPVTRGELRVWKGVSEPRGG